MSVRAWVNSLLIETWWVHALFLITHDILQTGGSPLYSASFYGHQKCVQLLLEAGAIIDVQTNVSVYVRQCTVKAEVPVSFTHVSTFKAFSF